MNFSIKNTSKSKLVIGFLALSFGVTSCSKDYFDKQPLDAISDATFWKTEKDAQLALTGCYNIGAFWTSETFWMPKSLMELDLGAGYGSEKELRPDHVTDGTLTSAYWYTGAFWSNAYSKIAKCNNFLDHVGAITMDAAQKKMMIAEVKALRAYDMYNLALYFGAIPMPTTALNVASANSIARTPQTEVYAFLEKDLKESAADLPLTRPASENGRITRGAAMAILGRIQMAQKKWSDAAATYTAIMNSNVYSIEQGGYKRLFIQTGENSSENILAAQFQEDTYADVFTQYLYPETWGGWHQFSPYNELVEMYECRDGLPITQSPLYNPNSPYDNRDPRMDYTIMINNRTRFKGTTYVSTPSSSSPDRMNKYNWSGYCINKYMDSTFSGNLMNYGGNHTIIRYAEVLLSCLEAKLEAGEAISQATLDATINKVRTRPSVNMPPVTTTNVTALRTIVRRERTTELAFEGVHYFDILRWGIAATELNRQFHGMKLTNDPANYTAFPVNSQGYFVFQRKNFVAGKNELWPIPQTEMDINKKLTQNPGY
jgi:starch-binding outer membrane protein, SusD/RagB family